MVCTKSLSFKVKRCRRGRGDPPIFSTGIEPLARMTQYLADENALGDFFGVALEDNPSIAD